MLQTKSVLRSCEMRFEAADALLSGVFHDVMMYLIPGCCIVKLLNMHTLSWCPA